MKIKSNLNANYGINNVGTTGRVLIPAGGVLELDDKIYKQLEKVLAKAVKSGALEIIEKPALSKAEKAAEKKAAIEAAKALIADADADADKE